MADARVLLPIFLDLAGRSVLVAGGGEVAARKVEDLLAAKARIRVVAPEVHPSIVSLAAIVEHGLVVETRPFADADVAGAWLVIAATDDAAVQAKVAEAADRERVFCIAVDDPKNATAYGGGVVRRGPVTIAISTSGEAPAIARLLREIIEEILPEDDYLDAARALREKWKAEKTPMGSRFAELVRTFKEKAG